MSQELRYRAASASATATTTAPPTMSSPRSTSSGLTASSLLRASPQQHGRVLKLHIPLLYSLLPAFLQRWIVQHKKYLCLLSGVLAPQWKPRYLILLGSFLYRFASTQSNVNNNNNDSIFIINNNNQEIKGTPIDLESFDVHVLPSCADLFGGATDVSVTAATTTTILCLQSLRKAYYFAFDSQQDANTWLESIRQAKQESIRRNMGHAAVDSYPTKWSYYDRLGQQLVARKQRLERKLQESTLKEMELSTMVEGGPAPRGYFG